MQRSKEETTQAIIDPDGYRRNVGMIILNANGQVFWAKRVFVDAWQFPQGGIHYDEHEQEALARELFEEVGLSMDQVEVLSTRPGWLSYDLPEKFRRRNQKPYCVGQKQKWFLLRLRDDQTTIDLNQVEAPEFERWTWVSYWYPISKVISFKETVYRDALTYFAPIACDHLASIAAKTTRHEKIDN